MEPTGVIWLILSVLCAGKIRSRQWRKLVLPGAAWLLLTLTSATALSHTLLASLEAPWEPVDVAALPECDAVVVLGGARNPPAASLRGFISWVTQTGCLPV